MSPQAAPRLSLIVLRALEPETLVQFYTVLGMRFAPERHVTGPLHYVSSDAGFTFEIYPRYADQPDTTATRLGFEVVALDQVIIGLTAAGGKIIRPLSASPSGCHAVIVDPEGHTIELTERYAEGLR